MFGLNNSTLNLERKNKFILKNFMKQQKNVREINAMPEYQKLRDMIIKLEGFYEPAKFDISSEINLNLVIPGLETQKVAPNVDAPDSEPTESDNI